VQTVGDFLLQVQDAEERAMRVARRGLDCPVIP
jgi:hypothetical protein